MKTASRPVETRLEKQIRRTGYINGIYTPWFNGIYGNDIGTSILHDYKECRFD